MGIIRKGKRRVRIALSVEAATWSRLCELGKACGLPEQGCRVAALVLEGCVARSCAAPEPEKDAPQDALGDEVREMFADCAEGASGRLAMVLASMARAGR